MNGPNGNVTEGICDPLDNTIEVMLSPQQLRALARDSQAAEAAGQRRRPLGRMTIAAGAAVALIAIGGVAHLAAKQRPVAPPPVVQALPPPPPPPPAEAPAPAGDPVLFKNPFDRKEVFEFPPGTTRDEAREAVAKILMDRAQERGPIVLKHHKAQRRLAQSH